VNTAAAIDAAWIIGEVNFKFWGEKYEKKFIIERIIQLCSKSVASTGSRIPLEKLKDN
jgi:hypothetical protein